jgi:YfiH family protein
MAVEDQVRRLDAANLSALPGIAHGFFGRTGGVSTGIFASLHCGFTRLGGETDGWGAVVENRRRVAAALGGAEIVTLSQVHSPKVVTVTAPWALDKSPQADAMVTAKPGIALGILTADCAPVLFADADARVIGAAHAGWKGAFGGVLEATLTAMEALGARRDRIAAAIGPCIGQANYEVGPEFFDRFVAADAQNAT